MKTFWLTSVLFGMLALLGFFGLGLVLGDRKTYVVTLAGFVCAVGIAVVMPAFVVTELR